MVETTGIPSQLRRIRRDMLILLLVWSMAVVLSLAFSLYRHNSAFYSEVYARAQGIYTMDRSYRDWAIRNGGVYVPATKETQPSPYLKDVPERDVRTPSGRTLTLLNSSYMTRQVHDLMDKRQASVRGHIASLRPINPANRADAWERQALRAFEQGKKEVSGIDRMADGKTYFRYMQPMITEQTCLKCHAEHGDKLGAIRGGISVSIPINAPLTLANRETMALLSGHGLIWLLGLAGIYVGGRRQQRSLLEVEQSEAEVLLLANSIAHAIYGQDLENRCTFANEACLKMLGYDSESELLGKDMHALMHHTRADGSPYPADECPTHRSLQERQAVHVDEETLWRKDGSSFPAEYWSYPVMLDGKLHGIVVTFLDISEKKRMEDELRSSRQLLDSIVEHMPAMVFLKDAKELRFELFNRSGEKILGYSRHDLLGKNDHDLFPKEQADFFTRNDLAVLNSHRALEIVEEPITTADGQQKWLHTFKVGLYDADNQPTHLLGVSIDITPRKRMEEKLVISRHNLAEAQRIAHIGSWELDLTGNALLWSDEIYRMFEIDAERFGASYEAFLDAIHPDDREAVNKVYTDSLQNKTPYEIEHRLLMKDGRIKYVQERCETTYDEAGKPLRSLGTVQDITERKLAEKELQRVNRALRALSAGNHALIHAESEQALLENMCRAVIGSGYELVWVGYAMQDKKKSVVPMAMAGDAKAYVDSLNITWDDQPLGRGPTGLAIRSGQPQFTYDIRHDPCMEPWREAATRFGFASSIALPLTIDGTVIGALMIYSAEAGAFGTDQIALLEEMASDLAFGIATLRLRQDRDRAVEQNQQHMSEIRESLVQAVAAIAKAVEARDPYTAGHQRRVAELACAIAKQMGLDDDRIEGIRMGATIHDIGKIQVPAEMLTKPAKLTEIEFRIIKGHPGIGYSILQDIHFPWPVADIAHQHHERMDGSGYPQGLKGDQISLEARIVAVADVVEAMSSHRPYRPGLGIEAALAEVSGNKGRLYDSGAVEACLKVFAEGFHFE